MATENIIKTRILNNYGALDNYTDFTPLKGEICIAVVGEETTTNKGLNGDIIKKPIVGIKVGDGNITFENLPWIQAIAGDVSTFIKGIVDEDKFNELVNAIITNAKLATAADLNALTVKMSSAEERISASSIKPQRITIIDNAEITLEDNTEYIATTDLTTFIITIPEIINEDFRCAIDFGSGSTATTFVYPENLLWSGDNLNYNRQFIPVHNHRYHIDIWFDGVYVRANASGVMI